MDFPAPCEKAVSRVPPKVYVPDSGSPNMWYAGMDDCPRNLTEFGARFGRDEACRGDLILATARTATFLSSVASGRPSRTAIRTATRMNAGGFNAQSGRFIPRMFRDPVAASSVRESRPRTYRPEPGLPAVPFSFSRRMTVPSDAGPPPSPHPSTTPRAHGAGRV